MISAAPARLVWDLPLRLFHWLLVLAVLGCWWTSRLGVEAFFWHGVFGYATLILVGFRIGWGFAGPRHARFAAFLRGPRATWTYLRSLARGEPDRHAGHNPAGALMVVLLLLLVLALGITGLFANDEILSIGPLYGYVSDATSDRLSTWHGQLMDVLWVVIAAHVIAVFGYLLVKRQNLIWPMITGRKRATWLGQDQAIGGSALLRALLLAAVCGLMLYVIVATAPEPSLLLF